MNYRFGSTFLRFTARNMFARPQMTIPVKNFGFATMALRMQDL